MKNGKFYKFRKVGLIFWCFWCLVLTTRTQVNVQEVVDTELAFAKMAFDQETRAAYLAYMSEKYVT